MKYEFTVRAEHVEASGLRPRPPPLVLRSQGRRGIRVVASRRTERATTHAFVILSDDDSRALKFRPSTKGSGVAQTPARAFAGGSRGLAPHPIAVDCGFVTKR